MKSTDNALAQLMQLANDLGIDLRVLRSDMSQRWECEARVIGLDTHNYSGRGCDDDCPVDAARKAIVHAISNAVSRHFDEKKNLIRVMSEAEEDAARKRHEIEIKRGIVDSMFPGRQVAGDSGVKE